MIPRRLSSRFVRISVAISILSLTWLVILPGLTDLSPIRDHILRMESASIDPSAMFYTELDGLAEAEGRLRRIEAANPGWLWDPSGERTERD